MLVVKIVLLMDFLFFFLGFNFLVVLLDFGDIVILLYMFIFVYLVELSCFLLK